MRPAGKIRQDLMLAARDVVSDLRLPKRGATLAELAARACVCRPTARRYLDNMRRSGAVQIVGTRRVDYRNRPVAEYAPGDVATPSAEQGWVGLGRGMASWVR